MFLERVLTPLLEKLPNLKVVLEHVTTSDAVDFVLSASKSTKRTQYCTRDLLHEFLILFFAFRP